MDDESELLQVLVEIVNRQMIMNQCLIDAAGLLDCKNPGLLVADSLILT